MNNPMMEAILGDGGWLAEHLPNFKSRPIQVELASLIDEALYEGHHLLGEWPTGTGKSMAYGIPAAIYALDKQSTVVVVTANITLQEQLANKDFPLIADVLDGLLCGEDKELCPRLTWKLCKGMANYLCLDKLAELETSANPPTWLREFTDWAAVTETGDKSELQVEHPHEIWGQVSSNSDECTKNKCEFFKKCYAMEARTMNAPNVVITNYHMLFTDIMVRAATMGKSRLLPPYKVLIMDEAHEAADIAMSFSGFEISPGHIRWVTKRITKSHEKHLERAARVLNTTSDRFFKKLSAGQYENILVKPLGFDEGLVTAMKDVAAEVDEYVQGKTGTRGDNADRTLNRLAMMGTALNKRASSLEGVCFGFEDPETGKKGLPDGRVFFVEKDHEGRVKLCCKVVEVAGFFRETIFSKCTTIGVSATMTDGGSFKFVSKHLGLQRGEFIEKAVESPFDPGHVLIVIPKDVPVPKRRDEHTEAVARVVERVANDLGGRTMALFTSYRALNKVYRYLMRRMGRVKILVQGELPKSRIIQTMRQDPHCLILATASFWQGVDIPGQNLSCVVIDKFPFTPPSDPVLQYMEEKLGMSGGSAFKDYSIPKAIISLKQGVGRLIRTESDFGVVVLCDNRIDTTGYGKRFNRAFPKDHYRSVEGDLGDVKGFLRDAIDA